MKPDLLDALYELEQTYADRPEHEVLCIRMARSLIETARMVTQDASPPKTMWNIEQFHKIRSGFELIEGSLVPKHWHLAAEIHRANE